MRPAKQALAPTLLLQREGGPLAYYLRPAPGVDPAASPQFREAARLMRRCVLISNSQSGRAGAVADAGWRVGAVGKEK